MTIKALTISEPWASKIAAGEKPVENRGWFTGYRGWLAIHAGRGSQYLTKDELRAYPVGKIIALAWLGACIPLDVLRTNARKHGGDKIPGVSYSWREIAGHQYTDGPICLILDKVFKLPEPVAIAGNQGLWNPPEEVVEVLRRQHRAHLEAQRRLIDAATKGVDLRGLGAGDAIIERIVEENQFAESLGVRLNFEGGGAK